MDFQLEAAKLQVTIAGRLQRANTDRSVMISYVFGNPDMFPQPPPIPASFTTRLFPQPSPSTASIPVPSHLRQPTRPNNNNNYNYRDYDNNNRTQRPQRNAPSMMSSSVS
eukprot:TRINITY_DN312_c0_g1_i1.p2 TRINITY_DN312_c0_g1~~TRINITY_DN312_c0_g1_i1.p2  ORF type:complete len:110 (-),score=17.37 TRINITY_DN312_c0_g1_i1:1268-1597(-)